MRNCVVTAALLLAAALSGCSREPAADPEALARYARAKGLPAPTEGATTAPDLPPAALASPGPARRVRLTVVSGAELPDMDAGPGVTEPYVVLELDTQRQKTSIAQGLTPTWGDSFVFDVHPKAALMATLMDSDTFSDETIGVVTVQLPQVVPGASADLELAFRGGEHGKVLLRVEGLTE